MKYLFSFFAACLLSLNLSAQIQSGTLIHAQKLTIYEYNAYTNEYDESEDMWVSSYFYFENDFFQVTINGEQEEIYWDYEFSDDYGNDYYRTEDGNIVYLDYEEEEIQFGENYNIELDLYEMLIVISAIELVE